MTYSIETCLKDFREKYNSALFDFKNLNLFNSSVPVFLIKFDNEVDLTKNWEDIYKTIALDVQTTLTDEFSIWNIYLIFQSNKPINKQLKYSIENNTFSSRKIVIENDMDFDKILTEKLPNSHLIIEKLDRDTVEFIPNNLFWDELKNKNPKTKLTEDLKSAYSKIKSHYEA